MSYSIDNKNFLIGLDKNFQRVLTFKECYNLIWTRKYYESGTFTLSTTKKEFLQGVKYIYRADYGKDNRPCVGIVNKVTLTDDYCTYEGYFLGYMLNRAIVENTYSISQSDTETAIYDIVSEHIREFDIGTNTHLGNQTDIIGAGEYLDVLVYNTLQVRQLSYKVDYDFESNKMVFSVYQGLDRTHSQNKNNRVMFSKNNKNLMETEVIMDDSEYKNMCVVYDTESKTKVVVDNSNGDDVFQTYLEVSIDTTDTTKRQAEMKEAGQVELLKYQKVLNIEGTVVQGKGYQYLVDYDLGDKVEVEYDGLLWQERIISIEEVYKNNARYLTVEFGDRVPTIVTKIKEVY